MFRACKLESRDIDDAAERVGRGKIIDRSCLDNYGYPMRRAYLQFHGPPPLPLFHREREPAIPPHSMYLISMIDCCYRLSKLHTVNHGYK